MDRRHLEQLLSEGLSLAQIGALVGRHPSTVAYWLSRHGLKANGGDRHSPKGGVPREELQAMVEQGHTLAVIAESFDLSITTIRYWIKRYGLPRPHTIRRGEIDRAIEEGRRTLHRECKRHGWTVFVIENSGRARCRQCRIDRVSESRRRTKALLVREAGGACVVCGYDRCLAALQFHHRDSTKKSFAISLRGRTRSIDKLRQEAKKCDLLCANCHAAVEVGQLKL
jgi:Helix-turn-helix domain